MFNLDLAKRAKIGFYLVGAEKSNVAESKRQKKGSHEERIFFLEFATIYIIKSCPSKGSRKKITVFY